jgi:hypothetical protein
VGDGSEFLKNLFDDPLPATTDFHYIYGLGGEPDRILGEENDGILSKVSLARAEPLAEARSVTFLADADHKGIIKDPRVISKIKELLNSYSNK